MTKPIYIFMDINGTIMLEDSMTGLNYWQAIIKSLASTSYAYWEAGYPYSSYREMVDKVWAVDKSKEEKQQEFDKFFERTQKLAEQGIINQVEFSRISDNLKKADIHKEYYLSHKIFPSFSKFINYLDIHNFDYSLIYRTFGKDYELVATEELLPSSAIATNTQIYFQENGLGNLELIIDHLSHNNFIDLIKELHLNKAILVIDNYDYWNKNGRKEDYGKPMPYKLLPNMIIFDDNILNHNINLSDDNFLPLNNTTLTNKLIEQGIFVPVDTCQALANEDYFIDKFEYYLEQNIQNETNNNIICDLNSWIVGEITNVTL